MQQKPLITVGIGEVSIASGQQKMYTLLGSCVALMLYDSKPKIGGMAHVVLANQPNTLDANQRPGKYADAAFDYLLQKMLDAGAQQHRLRAKLAGGSAMFDTSEPVTIGQRNQHTLTHLLKQHGIPLVSEHCGGTQGRRVTFDLSNGQVRVEQLDRSAEII